MTISLDGNVGISLSGNIVTAGNITANTSIIGNVISANSLTVTDSITANVFIGTFQGNISGNLVVPGANTQVLYNQNGNAGASINLSFDYGNSNLYVGGNAIATGNITGNYIIGNGSQLTGLPASYSNTQVSNYLASGAVSTDILTSANVSATGNVTGSYVLGNGALLTGINSTLQGNLQGNIDANTFTINNLPALTVTGNVTAGQLVGNGFYITGIPNIGGGGNSFIAAGSSNVYIPTSGGNVNIIVGGIVAGNITASNVSIGSQAGKTAQGAFAVAFGNSAGSNTQGAYSVAIGANAAGNAQSANSVAVGVQAGNLTQGTQSVAIGAFAANITQGNTAVAIGASAGSNTQGIGAVAVGSNAGQVTQGGSAVAVGQGSATTNQGSGAVAVGSQAAGNAQGTYAVAVGTGAGSNTQGQYGIAVGYNAGFSQQGVGAISIGEASANNNQGNNAIAIGVGSGTNTQGSGAVAMGYSAGGTTQGGNAIAIGAQAGVTTQSPNAISIGYQAGYTNQGNNSIAIGTLAGTTNQPANSIIINANTSPLNGTNAGLYIKPVRYDAGNVSYSSYYNPISNEVTYAPAANAVVAGFSKYTSNVALTGLAANSTIILNTQEAQYGNTITYNTTTGNLNLLVGSTYRLRAYPGETGNASVSGASIVTQWFDVLGNAWVGSPGTAVAVTAAQLNGVSMGTAEYIVTPNANAVFQYRVVTATNTSTLGAGTPETITAGFPWIDVQVIAGFAPLTGLNSINVVGNITGGNILSNGLITTGGTGTFGNVFTSGTLTGNGTVAFNAGAGSNNNTGLQLGWNSAIRDVSANASVIFLDVGIGGSAGGSIQFRGSNSFTNYATINSSGITTNGNITQTNNVPPLGNGIVRTNSNYPAATAGTTTALDNLNVRLQNPSGGNLYPQISAITGSFNCYTTGTINKAGSALITFTNSSGQTVNAGGWSNVGGFGSNFIASGGDYVEFYVTDTSNQRVYRVTCLHGSSTNSGSMTVERIA